MPKTTLADAAPVETFELTLDEFCRRASSAGETVEMLGGFHAHAIASGLVKATEEAFAAALKSFASAPA